MTTSAMAITTDLDQVDAENCVINSIDDSTIEDSLYQSSNFEVLSGFEPSYDEGNSTNELLSVPKKVVVTSTSYMIDSSNVVAQSPVVEKGMTASVAYTKSLSASFSCSTSIGAKLVSGTVGFSVTGSISVGGQASQVAKRRGHLVLVPRYKVVNFNVYMKSRRPVGPATWVLIGKGTARKPENLSAIWRND